MKTLLLFATLALAASVARSDDLKTTDGKTYEEYTVVSHDDNGISVIYRQGQATIPFDNLPADLQKQYGYKPKEIEWQTDYAASLQAAKDQKKLVLLDFTGSNWCGYCQLLDKEVFPTPEFRAFVRANFIPVTLDYPRGIDQPDKLKKQNAELQGKYKIGGFPSLVVVDATGKEIGRATGYNPGSGSQHVISELKPFVSSPGN